jgi:hypothetical protein
MMAGVQGFSVSPFFRAFVEQMGGLKTAYLEQPQVERVIYRTTLRRV